MCLIFYPKDPRSTVKDVVITPDSITTNGMTLTWTRPLEPSHCENISYIVNYMFLDCENPNKLLVGKGTVVNEPFAVLTGLQPNWNYTFVVYAFTAEDGGKGNIMSDEVIGTTLSAGTGGWDKTILHILHMAYHFCITLSFQEINVNDVQQWDMSFDSHYRAYVDLIFWCMNVKCIAVTWLKDCTSKI